MNNPIYSYSKIISDDDWSLLEIIPVKPETKRSVDIIKLHEEEVKQKKHEVPDKNSEIRKNVLKGFGST